MTSVPPPPPPPPSSSSSSHYVVRECNDTTRLAPPIYILSKPTAQAHGGDGPVHLQCPEDYWALPLHTHFSNDADFEWPTAASAHQCCAHEMQPFTGVPVRLPLSYDSHRGYELDPVRVFCSFSCALQYVVDHADFTSSRVAPLIAMMAKEVYDWHDDLQPAPPREVLLTGLVTIEQFRSICQRPLSLTLRRAPFFVAHEHLVSRPLRGHPDFHQISRLEHMTGRATTTESLVRVAPHLGNVTAATASGGGGNALSSSPPAVSASVAVHWNQSQAYDQVRSSDPLAHIFSPSTAAPAALVV